MADRWFIARNKNKFGPYPTEQMKAMAVAGQLLAGDMVLQNGPTKWMPTSQVTEFFPASDPPPPPPPIPTEPAVWHFTQDGRQAGPVAMPHLEGLADAGTLAPTDLVWKTGMAAWVAASSIQGLFRQPKFTPHHCRPWWCRRLRAQPNPSLPRRQRSRPTPCLHRRTARSRSSW